MAQEPGSGCGLLRARVGPVERCRLVGGPRLIGGGTVVNKGLEYDPATLRPHTVRRNKAAGCLPSLSPHDREGGGGHQYFGVEVGEGRHMEGGLRMTDQ